MAKRSARETTPAASAPPAGASAAPPTPAKAKPASTTTSSSTLASGSPQAWGSIAMNVFNHYKETTPQRTLLIDAFMAFLIAVGGLQFLYCVLAGNFVCSP